MLFRNSQIHNNNNSEVIYFPKYSHVPRQDSEICYYFAFLHLLAIHKINIVPAYIEEMMTQFKKSSIQNHVKILLDTIIGNTDNLLWIADEMLSEEDTDSQSDSEMSESEKNWPQEFVDKYGIEFSIARLLNLQVNELEQDELTTTHLASILSQHGPIALGSIVYTNLPKNQKLMPTEILSTQTHNYPILNIEQYTNRAAHYILLIGCKSQPTEQVYFIDPNYPERIFSMSFEKLKNNISIHEYVYHPKNKLKPDIIVSHHFMKFESSVTNSFSCKS